MPKSKWKEIERELKRGGCLAFIYLGPVQYRNRREPRKRIPLRTWRKMWAIARSNHHPIINQRTVIL